MGKMTRAEQATKEAARAAVIVSGQAHCRSILNECASMTGETLALGRADEQDHARPRLPVQ